MTRITVELSGDNALDAAVTFCSDLHNKSLTEYSVITVTDKPTIVKVNLHLSPQHTEAIRTIIKERNLQEITQ